MNDSELDRILKSAGVPERPANYWESFPADVARQVRRAPSEHERRPVWQPRLVWGAAFAVACLLIGFVLGQWQERIERRHSALLQNEEMLRQVLTLFPNRVRAIVQDGAGIDLVLSEEADVPSSTPLWVQICRGKECLTLVTFSGQELQIAGQRVTVLSDAREGVILMGDRFAWASAEPGLAPADLKIQAKALQFASLQ